MSLLLPLALSAVVGAMLKTASRPPVRHYPRARLLHLGGVLGEDARARILEGARLRSAELARSPVTGDDPDYRRSRLFFDARSLAPDLVDWIESNTPALADMLDAPQFAMDDDVECQLTVSGDGDYFRRHDDNGAPETCRRRLSWVYYAHPRPRRFVGGELVVVDGDTLRTLEPEGDSLVVFPSAVHHEIRPVRALTPSLDDARVTLNGWIRERNTT